MTRTPPSRTGTLLLEPGMEPSATGTSGGDPRSHPNMSPLTSPPFQNTGISGGGEAPSEELADKISIHIQKATMLQNPVERLMKLTRRRTARSTTWSSRRSWNTWPARRRRPGRRTTSEGPHPGGGQGRSPTGDRSASHRLRTVTLQLPSASTARTCTPGDAP